MGFTIPLGECFRGPLKSWVESLLLDAPVKKLDFLDAQTVKSLWQSFLRGEQYTSYTRVWSVIALIAWCEENRVNI